MTQSLLSKFLNCRERFRLYVVEGLRASEGFNHRTGYGDMWHVCEEAHAAKQEWKRQLFTFCKYLCQQYPLQQGQVSHWYGVCKVQFPLYVDYWSKHRDVVDRTPLLQEQVFDVPYRLPSGRTVKLRGKWDSVDLIGRGKHAGVYLQENKTKGDVNEAQLKRQLTFDLQTMFYLVVLYTYQTQPKQYRLGGEGIPRGRRILGVRYNVIRRPLSGGKGTIVRHKPTKSNPQGESKEEFYQRLEGIIREDRDSYFMRWKCEVSQADVQRFRRESLDPILEQMCDWWDQIERCPDPFEWEERAITFHWRHPFGVHNSLDEGYASDVDNYLATGSEVGLTRVETLFGELR